MKLWLALSLILLSSFSYAQTDMSGMITCFMQGKKDNAAAVALIKASIAAFEVGHVFEERTSPDSSIEITLKNKAKLTLTSRELQEARLASGFEPNICKTVGYANKCYAVMAKQLQSFTPGTDYATALRMLEGDVEISTIYTLLGLERNIKRFRKGAYVEHLCAIVTWKGNDAVFHCNGLIDKRGKERSMSVFYINKFQVVDEWDADVVVP